MIKRTIFLIIGVILVLIGIVGLFLPLIQGILLIIAGLVFIGKFEKIKFIDDLLDYLKKLFNKVKTYFQKNL
ncbi:MAG: hypothetical protein KJ583_01335 [Nanoarchaeota archaeon]|nr:hypothetical protein [Nanoarchaeota archaeon]MBU1269885.1 hypothetical protein [Nanoarchaeota archaeon]MBU1603935.1 hypothetical protein [Nanoarchaeota archaeon]MBU2442552.1 hypothetical protein [Nanoarchaeota archaeon]